MFSHWCSTLCHIFHLYLVWGKFIFAFYPHKALPFFLQPPPYFCFSGSYQHGLGLLHLLHGCLRHHPQLLHQDGDRVPAQAQAVRAGPARGAELPGPGGLPLLPGPFPPVHLQRRGGLPRPQRHQSWARGRRARSWSGTRFASWTRTRTG